jgi:iron(II)-dependent oxidoreductase
MPIPAGDVEIGSCGDADAWDNELPSHRQHVPALLLARDPVTAGEWLAFMAARGYDDERLWCAPGWRWRCTSEARAPLYWRRDRSGTWLRRTPFGERCVEVAEPVAHISWYEASAFARFAGARLPSEAEWETAASWDSVAAVKHRYPWGADAERPGVANWNNAHGDLTGIGCHPAGASPHGTEDMMGQVWEWVASAFSPYPGFAPQAYAEYSAPWFDGAHRVARGGSYLTAPSTARAAFRNWYLPHVREPVLGARLAWSAA